MGQEVKTVYRFNLAVTLPSSLSDVSIKLHKNL